MGKLTATVFLSLDGVMQAPGQPDEDRDGGFDLGGWQVPYADEDMGRFVAEWFARADAFLLGRKTYQIFADYWPHVTNPDNPVASRLNTLPKYVATRTLERADWQHTRLLTDNVAARVAEIRNRTERELQVHGSGDLLQMLMAHDLVDEYRLWIYPVVLGRGKRLFGEGVAPSSWRLTDTRTTSTGVAVHSYESADITVATGEFTLDQM